MAKWLKKKVGLGRKKVFLEPITKPGMSRKKLAAIIIGVAAASAVATLAAYFWFYDVKIIKYDMHLYVEKVFGFNVATDALWFGKIPPGGTSERIVNLKNFNPESRTATLYFFGDLAEWVDAGEKKILLGPNESKEVRVVARVPEDAPFGYRGGFMLIVFKKP